MTREEGRDNSGIDSLQRAIAAFLAWQDAGSGDRQALLAQHPDLSDLLEPMLVGDGDGDGVGEAEPGSRVLGDFRLLQEVGRGGMGVVYEARQLSLDRRVAVKVLPALAALHPRSVARFRREAAVIGRMHHPGIVDVVAVGQEGDTWYLAMELIDGLSLDRVIGHFRDAGRQPSAIAGTDVAELLAAQASMPPHETAGTGIRAPAWGGGYVPTMIEIGAQVAEALQHAHDQDVIHRDVKPSNVMIRTDGRVVLMDFGLARDESLPGMTASGEFAGTPFYVSPEQALGQSRELDLRTDVFSLGVTLYELVTLKRPFEADSDHELLDVILRDQPVDPSRQTRAVSRDLAAVILKALEKEPRRRYQSAGDLAADLRALLEYRPVVARHATTWQRLRRWVRREPLRAAMLSGLLLLVVLVTVWAFTLRAARDREIEARKNLESSLVREREARLDSDANFGLARDAVDRLQGLAADRLADVPHLEPVHREVLEEAARFYREFLSRRGEDPTVRLDAARAWARLADFEFDLDDDERAENSARKAEELLRDLVASTDSAIVRADLAVVLVLRASFCQARAEFAAAGTCIEEALALLDSAEGPESDAVLPRLLNALSKAGEIGSATSNYREALDSLTRGIELATAFLDREDVESAARTRVEVRFQHCLLRRGSVYRVLGRHQDALRDLSRAREMVAPEAEKPRSSPDVRSSLAQAEFGIGNALRATAQTVAAEKAYRRALSIYDRLAADFPAVGYYSAARSEARVFLGIQILENGRAKEASDHLEAAIEEFDDLVRRGSKTVERHRRLALAWISLGNARWSRRDLDGARVAYRTAIERLEDVRSEVTNFDEVDAAVRTLATAYGNLGGLLLRRRSSPADAEELLHRSFELCRGLRKRNPGSLEDIRQEIHMGATLGNALGGAGKPAEAEVVFAECRELGTATRARFPDDQRLQKVLVSLYRYFGSFLSAAGRFDEARVELEAAVEICERVVERDPGRPMSRSALAGALHDLAATDVRDRHFERARSVLERAIEYQDEAIAALGATPALVGQMVLHLRLLCTVLAGLGEWQELVAAARRMAAVASRDPTAQLYAARWLCRGANGLEARDAVLAEAVALLRTAVALGLPAADRLGGVRDLEPLLERADFRALMKEVGGG